LAIGLSWRFGLFLVSEPQFDFSRNISELRVIAKGDTNYFQWRQLQRLAPAGDSGDMDDSVIKLLSVR